LVISDQTYLSEVYPIMTFAIRKLSLPVLSLCWFLSPTMGHAQSSTACTSTVATLQGSYAVLVSGETVPVAAATQSAAVPETEKYLAGTLQFDGQGNITTGSVYSGSATSTPASGSYSLQSDCTFSMTLNVGSTPQSTTQQLYRFAVVSSKEAVGIEADASAVATIDLEAQSATSSNPSGTFTASCIGQLVSNSDLNVATFSNGAITGTGTYDNNGTIPASNVPLTGTYALNAANGTFTGTLTFVLSGQTSQTFNVYGVFSNAGSEVEYFYTTANGAVASCVGQQ